MAKCSLFEKALAVAFVVSVTVSSGWCDLEHYFSRDDIFATLAEEYFFEPEHSDTESFSGVVGAYNYTYYTYDGPDSIRIQLTTKSGDADLYIGEGEVRPTFDLNKHSLQSTTCGDEVVDVLASMKRPIGIGVYGKQACSQAIKFLIDVQCTGHPSHLESHYTLHVTRMPEQEREQNNGYLEDEVESDTSREKSDSKASKRDTNESDTSFAWELLITILSSLAKIILEVLT